MKNFRNLKDYQYYIAGLFEGDGHILIPLSNIKKRILPRWHITAHIKDRPCLEHLLGLFGHGFIREKKHENAVVWTIGNREGLFKLIDWLNGKLYTPKVDNFNKLIDWLNENEGANIIKLPLIDPTLNNSWFSGFVDADGCFFIRATFNSKNSSNKKERFSARMSIDQRIISSNGVSYGPIMNLIKETFKCKLSTVQKANGNSYFHLVADTIESFNLIINYFTDHPLLSSKYLDYSCWTDAILIKNNNKFLSIYDKENILFLKQQMNSNRKNFSWQHLPNIKDIKE